ncbi:hypothetical protein OUZ56_026935 [Daphnia magna]|uniref:G-protein coupled receptors family 1 profile domain-containing protein n=1 Tax=Daphnia magna TaxID=35525 RepID=A0ABQ9ZNA1_9CRUS|nr:hypothetical protein OUZ56_026935 [Daphnia magna]
MNFSSEATRNVSLQISLDVPMNIRPMSLTQQSYRYVIIVVGALINSLVVLVIRYSRQLHYPRHVYWGAISLINQCYLVQSILEIVAIVDHNRGACQAFVLNAGVYYTIMLTFLALAALDRYLAIARYEWYKRKVTNRATIYFLLFVYVVTHMAIISPFWTGFKTIKNCAVNVTHMHCVMIYDLLLGVLCVVLHLMIFIRSREATRQYPNFHGAPVALRFHQTALTNVTPATGEQVHANSTRNRPSRQVGQLAESEANAAETPCFPWLYNRPKFNRLEIRAAFSMSINVLPVWLCTFPVTVNTIFIYWCIRLETSCPIVFRLNPYLCDLFLFHTVYNPLMYTLTSTEFKRAVMHLKQKLKCNRCN